VLYKRWIMNWDCAYKLQQETSSRHAGDRFRNCGEDMIREAALAAIEMHKSLPVGQAESFAATFLKSVDKLSAA
jgi:hypothetical protein